MALSNDDWAEVLQHTRTRVREAGLSDVDERVALDFRPTESASADFLRYLDSVISALRERSSSTFQRAFDTFREYVRTEDGTPVQGIEVRVEERDFRIFPTHRIDLGDQPNLGVSIEELTRLRHALLSSGLFDEQSST